MEPRVHIDEGDKNNLEKTAILAKLRPIGHPFPFYNWRYREIVRIRRRRQWKLQVNGEIYLQKHVKLIPTPLKEPPTRWRTKDILLAVRPQLIFHVEVNRTIRLNFNQTIQRHFKEHRSRVFWWLSWCSFGQDVLEGQYNQGIGL
jgi:hypothetical protein